MKLVADMESFSSDHMQVVGALRLDTPGHDTCSGLPLAVDVLHLIIKQQQRHHQQQ